MGRELMRVPLDFKWPLNMIWKGYRNPYYGARQECKPCKGSGSNEAVRKLKNEWYGMDGNGDFTFAGREPFSAWMYNLDQDDVDALVAANRLWDFTRVPRTEEQKKDCLPNGWTKDPTGYRPTAEEVNQWSRKRGMGHDGCNAWICIKARAERLGVYGVCEWCNGKGEIWYSDEFEKLAEGWVKEHPPAGDGWQLWETTSEGSPITPVFATFEELCEWAATNATTFGKERATKEEWAEMLGHGFVHHTVGNMTFI